MVFQNGKDEVEQSQILFIKMIKKITGCLNMGKKTFIIQ